MARTQIIVRKTRNILDIYKRKPFVVVERSLGGYEVIRAKEATRRRATAKAAVVAVYQTSPTAGAGDSYDPGTGGGGGGGGGTSGRVRSRVVTQQY